MKGIKRALVFGILAVLATAGLSSPVSAEPARTLDPAGVATRASVSSSIEVAVCDTSGQTPLSGLTFDGLGPLSRPRLISFSIRTSSNSSCLEWISWTALAGIGPGNQGGRIQADRMQVTVDGRPFYRGNAIEKSPGVSLNQVRASLRVAWYDLAGPYRGWFQVEAEQL